MEAVNLREKINQKLTQDLDEFEVISRFIAYLDKQEPEARYRIADVDVLATDGRHNTDFLLQDNISGRHLAVELTMLYENERIFHARRTMDQLLKALRLKMASIIVDDFYYLQVPMLLNEPTKDVADLAEEITARVKDLVNEVRGCTDFTARDISFTFCRDNKEIGERGVHVFPVMKEYAPSPEFAERLAKAIADKNEQLSVASASRRLLVITDQFLVKGGCGFASLLLSKLDFTPYQNIDEIFYEAGTPGEFCTIYSKLEP